MNYGQSLKFEDLYPLDVERALIVAGKEYVTLNKLQQVRYRRETKGTVKISKNHTIFESKNYLRLGNIFNNELYYSEDYHVYKIGVEKVNLKKPEKLYMGIQPFAFEDGIVYQKKGSIYLNDKRILSPLNEYKIIGRPTIANGIMYYEARSTKAPQGWEIWRYNLSTKESEKILNGGNPYVYKNILFYSLWLDHKNEFEIRWENI